MGGARPRRGERVPRAGHGIGARAGSTAAVGITVRAMVGATAAGEWCATKHVEQGRVRSRFA